MHHNPQTQSSKEYLENPEIANIQHKDGIFHPQNVNEVKRLVDFARAKGATVRAHGAKHSPEDAIFSQNSKRIYLSLDGDLRKIHSIAPDESGEYARVSVGAGCNLGVNPKDKTSTLENSFNYQVDKQGYALPTLGGISHQTMAGFLQTSTSGGSAKHSIADVIEEIELINGKGELCTFKKGDPEFNAAVVSMGLFGVVTNVTFKLPKKYLVEGLEVNREEKDSYLAKDKDGNYSELSKALFEDNEYAHINWFPQKYAQRVMQWTGKAVSADLPEIPYEHPLRSYFINLFAAIALGAMSVLDKVPNNSIIEKLKALLIKQFVNLKEVKEFRDKWYKALPIDDQADVDGLMKLLFSEIWFPKDKVDEVVKTLQNLYDTNPKAAGNFIVELYAAKQSPFWLSPSYGSDAFRVDLYWWAHNLGNAHEYFDLFWDALLKIPGARLHWGKYMPTPGEKFSEFTFNSDFFRERYPQFDEWLKMREKMDPQQLFVNDYWRNMFDIPFKLEKTQTNTLSNRFFQPLQEKEEEQSVQAEQKVSVSR